MGIYKRPRLFSVLLWLEAADAIYFLTVLGMNILSLKSGWFYPAAIEAGMPEVLALVQGVLSLMPGTFLWIEIGMCAAERVARLWANGRGLAIQYDAKGLSNRLSNHLVWVILQDHAIAFLVMMCMAEAIWHVMSGMLGIEFTLVLVLLEVLVLCLCRPALEAYYSLRYGRLVSSMNANE